MLLPQALDPFVDAAFRVLNGAFTYFLASRLPLDP